MHPVATAQPIPETPLTDKAADTHYINTGEWAVSETDCAKLEIKLNDAYVREDELAEACSKALSCHSIDSSVRCLIKKTLDNYSVAKKQRGKL